MSEPLDVNALAQPLKALTLAVESGQAHALRDGAEALRNAAMALLTDIKSTPLTPAEQDALREQLQAMAAQLTIQRAGMMRRAALVEHTLQAMVPGTISTTYDPTPAPYGSARKQTGAFKTLAA